MTTDSVKARVSLIIEAAPQQIYDAFVDPAQLVRFWLSQASGPLRVGVPVDWHFMVAGAQAVTTATQLEPGKRIAWQWPDGAVRIELEAFDGATAVTVVNDGFVGTEKDKVDAALNATEGFTIVLCDLKTLLEIGSSAGLTKSKARLIEARRK